MEVGVRSGEGEYMLEYVVEGEMKVSSSEVKSE